MGTSRKTKEQFIEQARKIHGEKYDYSKVEYINNTTKICIICPKHGEFWQTPKQHLRGQGCPKCGLETIAEKRRGKSLISKPRIRREHIVNNYNVPRDIKTTEQFIEQARKIHGEKYDYSKVEYTRKSNLVTIICPKHGEFEQKAVHHLRGRGCKKCAYEQSAKKQTYTSDEFISMLRDKYGDKYDYSKVEYKGRKNKVILICPTHGEFSKTASDLISKETGCPFCFQERKRKLFSLGKDLFIEKAERVFHGLYDYSYISKYVNNSTKVEICCKKHGIFLCSPNNHLKGRGCPICKSENYVYEERLFNFLKMLFDEKDIVRQYRPEWLTNNKSLDFFIPRYNLCIEHQGSQHYHMMNYINDNEERLKKRMQNDIDKYNECVNNNVNIIYFSYELKKKPNNCLQDLITDEGILKEKIINYIKNISDL